MNIGKSLAQIKNLNPRCEAHGNEIKKAVDVKCIIHIRKDAEAVLKGLELGGKLPLWGKTGESQFSELDMKLRHKVEGVRVQFSTKDRVAIMTEGDIKGIQIIAHDDKALEIACTIQGLVNAETFTKLWNMWITGDCKIAINELQPDLAIAS